MNEAIEGLNGVTGIADDVLVYGCGETVVEAEQDHDQNLRTLLDKSRSVGIQWSSKKFTFRVLEVTYVGHKVT